MKKTTGPKVMLHKGEKFILTMLAIFAVLTPLVIVYTTAQLSTSNYQVEELKQRIAKQENVNSSLTMQVDELASLSNIQDIAKTYGLSYNNDNIVVIK